MTSRLLSFEAMDSGASLDKANKGAPKIDAKNCCPISLSLLMNMPDLTRRIAAT